MVNIINVVLSNPCPFGSPCGTGSHPLLLPVFVVVMFLAYGGIKSIIRSKRLSKIAKTGILLAIIIVAVFGIYLILPESQDQQQQLPYTGFDYQSLMEDN